MELMLDIVEEEADQNLVGLVFVLSSTMLNF